MINPRVSVILPCYNHSKFLVDRIKSILKQTYPVSEIIFLDDASSDNSVEVARALLLCAPMDVTFSVNTSNSGSPFVQWNRGVRMAKNEVIWIAETDDACDSEFLECLIRKYEQTNSALVFSQSRYISSEGADLGSLLSYTSRYWPLSFKVDFSIDGRQFNSDYMTRGCAIPNASAVVFSRKAFIDVGMSNESMFFSGDWDIWIRIASRGKVSFLARELNFFRIHQFTTRAKGITARGAAEGLACRINSMLQTTEMDETVIRFAWILSHLEFYKYPLLDIPFRSFYPKNLREIKSCYSRLKGVPVINYGTWLAVLFTSCTSKLLISLRQFYLLLLEQSGN